MSEESTSLSDRTTQPTSPGSGAGGTSILSCAPNVGGLVPSDIPATKIHCPNNYLPREGRSAVPVAGRFTSEEEVIDAFCVETKSAKMNTEVLEGTLIDFDKNVVIAFAYDASTGDTPKLYRRGDDLWLKVTQDECRSTPELTSVVFVVPKSNIVSEQTCSRSCQ